MNSNKNTAIVTRFAPSPTGFLHIGGGRTALFNYLYAKANGGKFLLRIEDTDEERNSDDAVNEIVHSMEWLDLPWDGEVVYQSKNKARHQQVAQELLATGLAYECYTSQDEINQQRQEAIAGKESFVFKSKWRNQGCNLEAPSGVSPVIRLRSPDSGASIIFDHLQGQVSVQNDHLDDMILLRSDGTPTYMLAVVVDDHDMGVTHIIRGDDHLNNAIRQKLIYDAMGWQMPEMTHVPLIHGSDGAKLSKRHGALGVSEYQKMGFLPKALCNYLIRLGWSHGDDEIISRQQAIAWFGLENLSKGPSRLDSAKMQHLNAIYLRAKPNEELAEMIYAELGEVSEVSKKAILAAINEMKPRAELITDLMKMSEMFVVERAPKATPEAEELMQLADEGLISAVIAAISSLDEWKKDDIMACLKVVATDNSLKLGALMKFVRPFITGQVNSPSVFAVMAIIGKETSLKRLGKAG